MKTTQILLLAAAAAYAGNAPVPSNSDVSAIRARGELRILMTASPEIEGLPTRISPRDYDRILLQTLAERLAVPLKFIYVEKFENLLPALLAGQGDIIADNLCITEERQKIAVFTQPLSTIQDQIVTSTNNRRINKLQDLVSQIIYYERGTSYLKSLEALQKTMPTIRPAPAPAGLDTESLLFAVAAGKYTLAIADSNYTETHLDAYRDLKIIHTFPEKQHTAWLLRKDSPGLLRIANNVIADYAVHYGKKIIRGDLPEIKKRKVLRVLTRNNPLCYFIQQGRLMGFEYDLAREFAKRQGLQLVMVVPPQWSDLIPWLIAGKGDIIAAAMEKTAQRAAIPEIAFCAPYCVNRDRIIGRAGTKPFKDIAELKNHQVYVRKSSGYWEKLAQLQASGIAFELKAAPEELETFEIIGKVASGEYDLTVADEHIFKLEKMRRDDIAELFCLEPPIRHQWCVRAEDTELKKAVDEFFKQEYKGTFFNCTYNKYFAAPARKKLDKQVSANAAISRSELSNIIKTVSAKYGFDWLFICAQIYQESRFDEHAVSPAGTKGLMQIHPDTAAEIGFKNIDRPADNINAGVKYLYLQKDKLEDTLREKDALCFALASYNAGFGHIQDARQLARACMLDDDRWFDNVEKCVLLLEKPQYHRQTKFGYCRGSETAHYVRNIMIIYDAYKQAAAKKPAPKPTP